MANTFVLQYLRTYLDVQFGFSAQMLSLTGTLHHSKSMYRTLIYYHVRCLFHIGYDLLLSSTLRHM
jgi:hypothetical protein